jgi:hypothetical protein
LLTKPKKNSNEYFIETKICRLLSSEQTKRIAQV